MQMKIWKNQYLLSENITLAHLDKTTLSAIHQTANVDYFWRNGYDLQNITTWGIFINEGKIQTCDCLNSAGLREIK